MVTAAAIAMVLGMESSGARSVPSGDGSVAGMPFAMSMEAEMAVSAPVQPSQTKQMAQGTATESVPTAKVDGVLKLEAALKGKFTAPAATPEKAGAAESGILQSGAGLKASTGNTKALIPAASVKVSTEHPEEKEAAEIADTAPAIDERQAADAAASIETPTGTPNVAGDVAQQPPAPSEDVKAATPNEAETIKPMPNVPEDVEKTAELELKDGLTGTVVGLSSHKATVKGDEVAKKEEPEKGDKAERLAAEEEESAVAVTPASVPVSVQLAVPSARSGQVKRDTRQEGTELILPASSKGMAGTKDKLVSLANGKGSNKHPEEKTGLGITSKLPSEGELKKPDSGRKMEPVGGAAAGVETSKTHNDGPAAHVEGTASGTTGIMPAAHLGHVDAVVLRPEPANPQGVLMQHGTALQSEAHSDMLRPGEPAPRTIMATPTVLEVGVANGAHGWLKVRAEMASAGTVNASLATTSTSGQEMLHRELPSLTAYLHSEHVAINTIVVQQASVAAPDLRGHTAGTTDDGRGQAGQSSGQSGGENRQQSARYQEPVYRRWSEGREEPLPPVPYVSGGGWLSVRA